MSGDSASLNRSLTAVERAANEHAENTLLLHPDLPAVQVADEAVKSLDEGLRAELEQLLLRVHFASLVRIARRKLSPPRQPALPGFDHLPARIRDQRGKVKAIQSATYKDMEKYVEFLGKRFRDTPKYKEAVKLRDRLKRRKDGATAGDLFE